MTCKRVYALVVLVSALLAAGCETTSYDQIKRWERRHDSASLATMVRDQHNALYVRTRAVDALGRVADATAIDTLIDLLRDTTCQSVTAIKVTPANPYYDIRTGQGGERYTIDAYPIREAATEALQKATGQIFGKDSDDWKTWWRNNKDRFEKKSR